VLSIKEGDIVLLRPSHDSKVLFESASETNSFDKNKT
jgi:hypothetical protein